MEDKIKYLSSIIDGGEAWKVYKETFLTEK